MKIAEFIRHQVWSMEPWPVECNWGQSKRGRWRQGQDNLEIAIHARTDFGTNVPPFRCRSAKYCMPQSNHVSNFEWHIEKFLLESIGPCPRKFWHFKFHQIWSNFKPIPTTMVSELPWQYKAMLPGSFSAPWHLLHWTNITSRKILEFLLSFKTMLKEFPPKTWQASQRCVKPYASAAGPRAGADSFHQQYSMPHWPRAEATIPGWLRHMRNA